MTDSSLPISPSEDHRSSAPDAIRCAVLTMSDTRTADTDRSGAIIRDLLTEQGHVVVEYAIVRDEPAEIAVNLALWLANPEIDAILANGGTGISKRDTTYDVVSKLIERRLDGFGELFRMLSYQEIGAAAMMSRAVAGVHGGTFIVSMPGSSNAVTLAMTRLIIPELGHVVFELRK